MGNIENTIADITTLTASERAVLHILRENAEGARVTDADGLRTWCQVYLPNALKEWLAGDAAVEGRTGHAFAALCGHLKAKGYYKPMDADFGDVLMGITTEDIKASLAADEAPARAFLPMVAALTVARDFISTLGGEDGKETLTAIDAALAVAQFAAPPAGGEGAPALFGINFANLGSPEPDENPALTVAAVLMLCSDIATDAGYISEDAEQKAMLIRFEHTASRG